MDVMYFTIIEFNPSFIELYAMYKIRGERTMLFKIGKRMGDFYVFCFVGSTDVRQNVVALASTLSHFSCFIFIFLHSTRSAEMAKKRNNVTSERRVK